MKKTLTATLTLTSLLAGISKTSAHWTSARPDGHAPIGVMGDHQHKKGDWMASYRYMDMEMEGMDSAPGYMMYPTDMDMEMHMLGLMFASSDKLTWLLMANHQDKAMDMSNGSSMHSKGWGDVSFGGMYNLGSWGEETIFATLGLGLPTGSTDEKSSAGAQLPYGMQLGSGTWDIRPGITYLGQTELYSWGAQVSGIFRTGENDQGYQLGSVFEGNAWIARKLSDSLSVSARITLQNVGGIDGSDKNIANPAMSPTLDPDNYGNKSFYGALGLNYLFKNGHRVALEYQRPIDENLDGLQMKQDGSLIVGWQYAW